MRSGEEFDTDVRLFIYRYFRERGEPPTLDQTARSLGMGLEDVEASFRRLEAAHVLVFAPGTRNIWMANPLSATPTPFWVETGRGSWWGTCIWDALGIPAMLHVDGSISTWCPDCGDSMQMSIREGALQRSTAIAHFAVPARKWWENIGYT